MNNLEQQNIAITKLLSTLLGENYSQYSRENLYSLEEASTIAYIEIFGNDNKVDYEEEIYNNPNDRRTQLSIRKKLPDGTDKGYSNFKKKYKKCIDKFLKNVLGDKYGLDMFRILNEGNKIMYSISKDDIIFFNRVFFAYYPEGADDFDSIDYKNLSKKKFDAISIDRINEWKCLIKDMYTYHNTELTPDDIENIINDRFHLWKRNFYEVYNNFSMIMNDIVEFVKISEKLLDPVKTCTEELIHWTDVIDDIIFQIYNIYDPETTNKKKQNKEIISWNKKRQMNLENRRMEETKNLSNYMEISKYLQSAYQKYIVELQNENTDCCQNADYRNELTKINIFIRDIINKLIKTFNYYKYTNSDIAKSIENEIDVLMRISFDIYKNQQ